MKAVKFNLSGQFAFFRKPEYNKWVQDTVTGVQGHTFLTFNQIPKTYILGMLGALLGFPGFESKDNYYDRLKNIKISVIPSKSYFRKIKHTYTDHTGLVSKGSTLIIIEQLLINPSWEIIVSEKNNSYFEEIKEKILNRQTECHLYLGKNEFFAKIEKSEIIELKKADKNKMSEFIKINSMFKGIINSNSLKPGRNIQNFIYKEKLPVDYDSDKKYRYENFYFTNLFINKNEIKDDIYIYTDNQNQKEKRICLF